MSSDDAYQAVLAELTRMVDAWRIHRDVINRAVSQLNHEVIGFTNRLDKNDLDRGARQAQLDETLKTITDGQEQIRRWQWLRLAIEVAAIIIIAAYLIGRNT